MPSIALLVDHPQRDLLGLALVADRLCRSGVRCFLVPAKLAWKELCGLTPDLVLLGHLRQLDEKLVTLLDDLGSLVAVLDTEGGVLESIDAYEKSLSNRLLVREAVRCYCAWGQRQKEAAEQGGWFPRAEIVVTGQPRFDFYADPWRQVARLAEGEPEPGGGPMALVAGTFTLANSRFLEVQDEVRLLIEEAHLEPAYVENRLQCEREALLGMVRLSGDLAAWAPHVDWVYRPHPFERRDTYDQALPTSVSVECGGSIQRWLVDASVLIQRGSTTAVEAAIAGVPVLSADWLPDWAGVESIRMVSRACASLDEMKAALEEILEEGKRKTPAVSPEAQGVIQAWFSDCDGLAHIRVAEALLKALPEDEGRVDRDRALAYFLGSKAGGASPSARLGGWIREIGNLPADFSFRKLGRIRGEVAWDSGGRSFSGDGVDRILELAALAGGEAPLRPRAISAVEADHYLRPYSLGRAVAIEPGGSGEASVD